MMNQGTGQESSTQGQNQQGMTSGMNQENMSASMNQGQGCCGGQGQGQEQEHFKQIFPEQHTGKDKGLGFYPISDLQFDVVTVVFEKSKALQAYDKYLRDCNANQELRTIFEEIVKDDKKHVEKLKTFLGNC